MISGDRSHPMSERRLLAILAHPDDESLGMGGALARYAAEGADVHVVTATRGDRGRYYGDRPRPSDEEVGRVREAELRAAAETLGVRTVEILGYGDSVLDQVPAREIVPRLVGAIRRVRPQVVVTFDPYGAYGHPDHIAISQAATAAVVAAADPGYPSSPPGRPGEAGEEDSGAGARDADGRSDGESSHHGVSKLYYVAWDEATWAAYQDALKKLTSTVDGEERQAMPWPGWSITTRIDTRDYWETAWAAVQCHETQMTIYGPLAELTPEHHEALWGWQTFYRVMSTVNGGRGLETDLFQGIDGETAT